MPIYQPSLLPSGSPAAPLRCRVLRFSFFRAFFVLFAGLSLTHLALAQEAYRAPTPKPSPMPAAARAEAPAPQKPSRTTDELKRLPLEQLVDVEISSASRRPEPLSHASSAIDVVTSEDIQRSGVTNIPDALRLAPEMQVAQLDGRSWAIIARGFNVSVADKMQVLMDGRSLYTPLFSGVFWDVQQTFLPDIAQIEIIRGPGATLWGANAINGVINILTKSAQETQGLLLYGGGGMAETGFGGLRYGGTSGKTAYRVYAMHMTRDGMQMEGGGDAEEETHITQGGFRIDSKIHPEDTLTVQGDYYDGNFGQLNARDIDVDGGNIMARWTRQLDEHSSWLVQTYFDHTQRLVPGVFEENRNTYDLEFQHQFRYLQHDLVWGGNYRVSWDDIGNIGPTLAFLPDERTVQLLSGFVQDDWHIVPDKFTLTVGTKLEYNSFSDFEFQPTGRFTWLPLEGHTIWGAVSRAVRTPTRIDQDLVAPNPSTGAPGVLLPNRKFASEELIAYELGYRFTVTHRFSIDLAGYYNDYDDLRSVEPQPGGLVKLGNGLEAQSYGGAITAKWRILDWWQVDGWVSGFQVDFHRQAGSQDTSGGSGEANDPDWMFVLHSAMDLPYNLRFDAFLRYVDDLPQPATPSYLTADLRLAWSPVKNVEVAIVGRNLFDDAHPEMRRAALTREVKRSVFGTFRWSF